MISHLFSIGSMVSFGLHGILIGILWIPFDKVQIEKPFLIHVVWETPSVPKQLPEKKNLGLFPLQAFAKKTALKRRNISLYHMNDKPTKNQDFFIRREAKDTLVNKAGDVRTKKVGNKITWSSLAPSQPLSRQNYHPLPAYPWICRKNGEEGEVGIVVKVNEKGCVTHAALFKSSGYKRLDVAAINSVKSWVYAKGGFQERVVLVFRISHEPQVHYMASFP